MKLILNFKLFICLCVICLLPSFLFVALSLSSLTPGLVVAAMIVLVFNAKYLTSYKVKLSDLCIYFTICLIILIASLFKLLALNIYKPAFSLFAIFLIFLSIIAFSEFLKNIPLLVILNTVYVFLLILIFIGWVKLFATPELLNYGLHSKAVFPFSEESHYALILGQLSIFYVLCNNSNKNYLIILNDLILSLIFPSLLLIVFAMLMIFSVIVIKGNNVARIIINISLALFSISLLLLMIDTNYFLTRLIIVDTNNLTTLVFLQGWELAYLNLIATNGIGLGFQSLGGSQTIYGYFSDLISKITENNIIFNASDGGFLVAKIIAEFGFVGIIIILIFIGKLLYLVAEIKKYNKTKSVIIENNVFIKCAIFLGLLPEMFLRGYGYFSPGLFLFLSFYIYSSKSNSRARSEIIKCA
ncbi:MAG: hypothetical protein AB7V48_18010 [Sedimentibacter sp.]